MASSTNAKQPLEERSSNMPSLNKSPSKIPLPPSPKGLFREDTKQIIFAEETGPMGQMFTPATLSHKPTLARKISEAHSNGQTYISPSDHILSPTTKKLSEVKSRRFGYVATRTVLLQLSRINTDVSSNFKKSSSLYNSQNIFMKSTSEAEGDTREDGPQP